MRSYPIKLGKKKYPSSTAWFNNKVSSHWKSRAKYLLHKAQIDHFFPWWGICIAAISVNQSTHPRFNQISSSVAIQATILLAHQQKPLVVPWLWGPQVQDHQLQFQGRCQKFFFRQLLKASPYDGDNTSEINKPDQPLYNAMHIQVRLNTGLMGRCSYWTRRNMNQWPDTTRIEFMFDLRYPVWKLFLRL